MRFIRYVKVTYNKNSTGKGRRKRKTQINKEKEIKKGKECVKSKILKYVPGRKYSNYLSKLKFYYSNVFQLVQLFAYLNNAAFV